MPNQTLVCDLNADGCSTDGTDSAATLIIILGAVIGILFGLYQYMQTAAISIFVDPDSETKQAYVDESTTKSIRDAANSGKERMELKERLTGKANASNEVQANEKSQLLQATAAPSGEEDDEDKVKESDYTVTHENFRELVKIYNYVQEGASSFLSAQYTLCVKFTFAFAIVIFVLCSSSTKLNDAKTDVEHAWEWAVGGLTAISFIVGALTSIVAGYIGMNVAVFANARVTVEAVKSEAEGWRGSFNAAFIAGSVMGFALCGLALVVLFILINIYAQFDGYNFELDSKKLFECIAGYGLGGSSMALFGRVGGGIFTKAADVGADLSGKVAGVVDYDPATGIEKRTFLDEDSPYNPATIADNVGDNVGDVAGMGSDLFGSFAEASCAALVISTSSPEIASVGYSGYMFPLMVSAAGIVVCMLTSFIATHVQKVESHADVEKVLKVQLFTSSLLMTLATLPLALLFLPNKFTFEDLFEVNTDTNRSLQECDNIGAWICIVCGLWGGCLIGFVTEYYTSHSYQPVRDVANSCESGAATNIIFGLALGYLSCIVPIVLLAINVFVAFYLCGMYGVSLAALGMLGTLATCLSIDVYGPIADNAGGLAEMAEFPSFVRDKTDALDAAGNTTAAIGKGFAIGSAALVSLALFGGFCSRLAAHTAPGQNGMVHQELTIDVLRPITFAFLFLGAMLPYWFTAFCMKSVGEAAKAMVENVKQQFSANGQAIISGAAKPDYDACIQISTDASLKEMIPPAMLVMLSPVLTGTLFGVEAVSGLLVGALISAVQLAISQSNSGGAWDNAKKYVEQGQVEIDVLITKDWIEKNTRLVEESPAGTFQPGTTVKVVQAKKSDVHKAAVIGDTVGDPLKDTSGPALNIVMKLMAILSLVFSDFFVSVNNGRGLLQIPTTLNLECTSAGECPQHH